MDNKILEYIERNFEKTLTLFLGTFVILLGLIPVDSLLDDLIEKVEIRYICYIPIIIAWIIFWFYKKNWLPKNKKNHIGLVICIETENDKQKLRLKNDFIKGINSLIDKHNLNSVVNIIHLQNYNSLRVGNNLTHFSRIKKVNTIDSELPESDKRILKKFTKIQNRIQGHFYVWGGIKERQDSENKYFLDLNGLVRHIPLDNVTQTAFQKEFQSIWTKNIEFQEKMEFHGFLFSAELTFIAMEHIVGLAALYSGNPFLALEMHLKVEKLLSEKKELVPNWKIVSNSVKALIPVEYILLAKIHHNMKDIPNAEKYLSKLFERDENNYNGYLMKSAMEFVNENNPKSALKYVNLAEKYSENDGTWRYNKAFLLMNLEKFEEALPIYRKITETTYTNEKFPLNEVLSFNQNIIKNNPEYYQAYFTLGYLYYKKLFNYPEALYYFEKYIEKCNLSRFNYLTKRVKSYIVELNERMELK